jgi:Holliday junction DNA helicase RuvA
MIAMLTGSLVDQHANRGILDVNGVGYEVFATATTLAEWAQVDEVVAHVSTQVREDSITLYGFQDGAERAAFLALLTVNGVGPKVALAALDALGTDGLASAVATDDVRALCRIPGVGKKTAQRLALELKGRITATFTPQTTPKPRAEPADPLPLALAQLGYKKSEIDRALDALDARKVPRDADTGERLRAALQILSGSRA